MLAPGLIGFAAPWLLLGLLALPVLWWLLRAVPPAAVKRLFPAVTLLLGLQDPETTPDKTPWWLLAMRILALAAMITGFAGPVLNPETPRLATSPLLILTDGSWATAPDRTRVNERITGLLEQAALLGRPAAVLSLADPPPADAALPMRDARDWLGDIAGLEPRPWEPDNAAFADWLATSGDQGFETIWLSDGLARDGRAALAAALQDRGRLTVIETGTPVLALSPPQYRDGTVVASLLRSLPEGDLNVTLAAFGPDPAGIERRLATLDVTFAPGETSLEAAFDLPSELRNRIRRLAIAGWRSAGAVALTDDALKRRKVALFAGQRAREGQELVSALHFLKKALQPSAELIEAPLAASLLARPDVVILADVAGLSPTDKAALIEWVEQGGLLVRFAGPKLAASSLDQIDEDILLPVRLRAGGRNVGGAMSWGAPKKLSPFDKASPFFGLAVPDDVEVTAQVVAQPDPALADRTIASLQDGTPLVTRKPLGEGQVVLFHVTANAEWSSLPLSGLFVQMLERLAISTRSAAPSVADLAGQLWQPVQVMNGFGDLTPGEDRIAVAGEALAAAHLSADLLPGTYRNGAREIALNVIAPDRLLEAAIWPADVSVEALDIARETPLMAALLTAALVLLLADILATLWLSGRLRGPRQNIVAALALALLLPGLPADASDDLALKATGDTVLAYVLTGDPRVDAASEAGLYGLSRVLAERTAVEPADPIAIDLESDELTFFPLIYWPVTEVQPALSDAAYDRLNAYLLTGGMILFDTRDANLGGFGSATPNGRRLQQIAAPLNIPALEPIPRDHVLTRAFYLLQAFPGRHDRAEIWVEAAPGDAEQIEGMPFRNLNDGVSPVVIGGNDWAAAWAMGRNGDYLYPVGRGGYAGERQREIAFRFGVNLVMYVLTGNYKSDQVHVPALLERLGQ
ncbi:MAG: DUF4159 domain-containing protein [Rhodobacteraceae bacterium]|nr:DUF4159 domain-containing protein [Paracoccaceae bacterium]